MGQLVLAFLQARCQLPNSQTKNIEVKKIKTELNVNLHRTFLTTKEQKIKHSLTTGSH